MATSKPVLFMSAKTPGNFQGKREQQEVRALALRAASFSRPNRRRKKPKAAEDSAPVSSHEASSSRRHRCSLPVARPKDSTQAAAPRVRCCCFCGSPLEPSPKDVGDASGNVQSAAPWHQICIGYSSAATPTSAVARLRMGGPDPFDSTPLAMTADDHDVLNYIKSFTFAINWPDELGACREGRSLYNAHLLLYRRYFTHPAPLGGLLSYVYNLMAIAQPEMAAVHRRTSMKYSLTCFKFLRDLIDTLNDSDEQLMLIIQTIWPLASAEYSESIRLGGDRSRQHRNALLRLIHLLGGLHRLPLVYRELFVTFFAKSAIVTGISPDIDPAAWDPGPWQGQITDEAPSRSVGEGSSNNPLAGTLDTLPDILAALRELVAVENIKRRGQWSDDDHLRPIFRWTYLRRMTLKMRLWNFHHPPRSRSESQSESLDSVRPSNHHGSHPQCVEDYTRASQDSCLGLAAQLFIYLSLETHPVRQPTYSAPIQYADMLERSKVLDARLFGSVGECATAIEPPGDPSLPTPAPLGDERAQAQARDLLWIVAVGACFEEDMSMQLLPDLVPGLAVTATAAGFWDQKGSEVLQCVDDRGGGGDSSSSSSTMPTPRQWFSTRFGSLARQLGYEQFAGVKELFSESYVYDAMIMEGTLNRLFTLGLSTSTLG
ncbi:hypothetical protein PV04_00921 [Phialophora macrospora]|uniref:Uncharacterized protein n=1 Tax=Phialophora macrospora TaxID=1851006 RepID=A0A0D2D565_9EURO|nr:hypothetical protein PV04_00921 [Phialophora macrospora]